MESSDVFSAGSSSGARPVRPRVRDELGRARTLGPGPFAPGYASCEGCEGTEPYGERGEHGRADGRSDARPLLFLGLGPEPAEARRLAEQRGGEPVYWPVYWVECPDFVRQMPPEWAAAIPGTWIRLTPEQVTPRLATSASVFRYAPALGLFSAFWGPLLAAVEAARLLHGGSGDGNAERPGGEDGAGRASAPHVGARPASGSRLVLLPGTERDLLTAELEAAFRANGFEPARIAPLSIPRSHPPTGADRAEMTGAASLSLEEILRHQRPALLLSVNLRGLDSEGRRFRLLRACGVPVAVWCVDNPWHLFSALRLPWWKEAAIFVTDASFIAPLREHGAAFVRHLPLGAWRPDVPERSGPSVPPRPADASALPNPPDSSALIDPPAGPLQPVVFVGRSAFPDRDRFFAGVRLPQPLWEEARARLDAPDPADLPHVHWWERALGVTSCWPGSAVRAAGLGAERAAALRRALWMRAALSPGLTVFGDDGWKELLPPGGDLRPPVDYYNGLFDVYARARYSLNVTSLLLPAGLTQRHFDVWMAGGFLLSDATPGLDIFPEELVRPVRVTCPARLAAHVECLERDPSLRQHLGDAWRALLLREHSYAARVRTLLDALTVA